MSEPSIFSDLSSLVDELGQQMPLLDAKRQGAEMYGAPRLSTFDLLDPNEIRLSRVLGDLFDPKGTHGQGPLFLNALLSTLNLPRIGMQHFVAVTREFPTQEGRRVDLVIETPSVILGIENKPWAQQQHEQLSNYLKDLEAKAGSRRPLLVFLSDQEIAGPEIAEIVRLPYRAADKGLSLCALLAETIDKIRAERSRLFVQEFMRYVERHVGEGAMNIEGDEPYLEAVQAEFEGGPSKRKALAVVLLAQWKLHSRIIDEIGDYLLLRLRETVKNDFIIEGKRQLSKCLEDKYDYCGLLRPSWPTNCGIGVSTMSGNFKTICFGVYAADPNSDDVHKQSEKGSYNYGCEARSKLESLQKIVAGGKKDAWWAWWQYADPRDWTPQSAARLVIQSPKGQVDEHPAIQDIARRVILLAEEVDKALGEP